MHLVWFGSTTTAHDLRFRCSRRFRNWRHWVAGDVHVRQCQYLIVEFWVREWVWRRPPATWVCFVKGTGGVWWCYFWMCRPSHPKVSRCSSVNFWSLTTFEAWIANGEKFPHSNVFSFFYFSVWAQNQDSPSAAQNDKSDCWRWVSHFTGTFPYKINKKNILENFSKNNEKYLSMRKHY